MRTIPFNTEVYKLFFCFVLFANRISGDALSGGLEPNLHFVKVSQDQINISRYHQGAELPGKRT